LGYAWYPANQEFVPGAPGWFVKNFDDDSSFIRYGIQSYGGKHIAHRTIRDFSGPYVATTGIMPAPEDKELCAPFADEWSVSQGTNRAAIILSGATRSSIRTIHTPPSIMMRAS